MKTAHRVLHEVLTPEEYKNLENIGCEHYEVNLNIYKKPSDVLRALFLWNCSDQGQKYWDAVYEKLRSKENAKR